MSEQGLIKHFTDGEFQNEIKKGVTLVDFHANWCGPCRMIAPALEEISKSLNGKVKIVREYMDSGYVSTLM